MQTQEKSLDELVKQYYEANPTNGATPSETSASRDDILNFVNQKGVPNDQSQSTTKQGTDVSGTSEPLEQAKDPDSAEAGLDKVLNEQAPGSVEPSQGDTGDTGNTSNTPALDAGGEGGIASDVEPTKPGPAEAEQQPASSAEIGTSEQTDQEGSAAQSEPKENDTDGGVGPTGEAGQPGADSPDGAPTGPASPEESNQSTDAEVQTGNNEENSSQSEGSENQSQNNENVDQEEVIPPEDFGEPSDADPANPTEDQTDTASDSDTDDDTAVVKTPEQEATEAQEGKDAAQALAVAADTPNAAPDPEKAVETETEVAQTSETDTQAQSEPSDETENTGSESAQNGTDANPALAPEIGTFDSAEKVLEVTPSHQVLNDEDNVSDAQVIKKAYGLNNRLGDYARIITDRFPNGQTQDSSQESLAFKRISRFGLEALTENGKQLLGEAFDPSEDSPVQEAILQSKESVLTNLDSAIKDLALVFEIAGDIASRSQAIIDSHDEAEGKASGQTAYRIHTALSIKDKIEFGGFGCSALLNNVLGDIKNWLASDYYTLLANLEKNQEGRIGHLVLASIPECSRQEELRSENEAGTIVSRQSATLPGEAYIQERCEKDGSKSAVFGFDGVDPFDAENPKDVVVPSRIEVQTLLNELNNAVITATGVKDLLTRLQASVTAFYAWYADVDPDQVIVEGADNLVSGLNFVCEFSAYLTNYIQSLSAYVLLEAQ